MKMIKMIPTHMSDWGVQYTLTNPNCVFKKEITDKFFKMKITNNTNDVLFDNLAKIKYIDDWTDGSGFSKSVLRYHLESENKDVNIFIVTDIHDKIHCMSVDYEQTEKSQRIEFKIDDRKTEYSTIMYVE